MLCGLLIAWVVMSVTSQVVQIGLCMGMTTARCNRMIFSSGCLYAGRFHYLQGSCVSTQLFIPISRLALSNSFFKILVFAYFLIPVPAIICPCFTLPIILMFVLVSQ